MRVCQCVSVSVCVCVCVSVYDVCVYVIHTVYEGVWLHRLFLPFLLMPSTSRREEEEEEEEITAGPFTPEPDSSQVMDTDRRTDRQTYRQTAISPYNQSQIRAKVLNLTYRQIQR